MRLFLDANILFSAAKREGAIRELVTLLQRAGHECCADAYVIEEARRNLAAKSPGRVAVLETLLSKITTATVRRSDPELEASLPLPEKDRPVLLAAIQMGCAALVTSDRTHFGPLYGRTIHGVTVYSPRGVADAILL